MKLEVSDYYKKKGFKTLYVSTSKEPRRVATLRKPDGTMITMAYAKYLYTSHYECDVPNGDQVDHINGDKMDDRIENLQVISEYYNIVKDHHRKEMVLCTCPICGEEFLFEKRNLSTHPEPCCSRTCGGKKSIKTARENSNGKYTSRALINGEIKDKIIELRKQGLSAYKIAEQITGVSRPTISRFLTANKL